MSIIESSTIISKQVLNTTTGELVHTNFREEKKRSGLKGGFRMVYTDYDIAMLEVVASRLDYEIAIGIREMYTKKQTEVTIRKKDLSEQYNTSEDKSAKLVARMVQAGLLLRVSRGTYRFNPFMYLPYMAPGAELQKEWNELLKTQRQLVVYKSLEYKEQLLDPSIAIKGTNTKADEEDPHIAIYESLKTDFIRSRFKIAMERNNVSAVFIKNATKMDKLLNEKESK